MFFLTPLVLLMAPAKTPLADYTPAEAYIHAGGADASYLCNLQAGCVGGKLLGPPKMDTFYIDARGADAAGLRRLEKRLIELERKRRG